MQHKDPNKRLLDYAHNFLIYLGGLYVFGLFLIVFPSVQTHVVYLHKASWPIFAQYHLPQKYGLAPYKAVNVYISTPDNLRLGAWFILSESFYQHASRESRPSRPFSDSDISRSIQAHQNIIFLHGNAANRAVGYRVSLYSSLTSRLGVNVLAIDYRGFGDSEGSPSEAGLGKDARAAWNWLVERGACPDSITILGHSLGTAVATMLASELAREDVHPRGLTLVAPFTSIKTLARTYTAIGGLPVLRPLTTFPFAFEFVSSFVRDNFDTMSRIPDVQAPILLIHSEGDDTIPSSHARALFDKLLEPLLPPSPLSPEESLKPSGKDQWRLLKEWTEARNAARERSVQVTSVENYAVISEFSRNINGTAGRVKHAETLWGGHTELVRSEGVVDLLGDFFNISRP